MNTISLMQRVDAGQPAGEVLDFKTPTPEELERARRGVALAKRKIERQNRADDARLLEAELNRMAAECNHE